VILVDTSVWVDHLRAVDDALAEMLDAGRVLAHPFVTGELALSDLRHRQTVIEALEGLPAANVATHGEVMEFIEGAALFGCGVGYVDVHLLAAVRLTPDARLWTRDRRLAALAAELGVAFEP
jgi:predicted nucleic acid-binding protein